MARYNQSARIVSHPLPSGRYLPALLGICSLWFSLSSLPSIRALGTRSGSRLYACAYGQPVSARRTFGPFSCSICPGAGPASAPHRQTSCGRNHAVVQHVRPNPEFVQAAAPGTETKLTGGCSFVCGKSTSRSCFGKSQSPQKPVFWFCPQGRGSFR